MAIDKYKNIAGAATTAVKASPGYLTRITVNKAVASQTITVYDSKTASGTKIATVTHPATLLQTQYVLDFGFPFGTGLTVVTSGADDITVNYQ